MQKYDKIVTKIIRARSNSDEKTRTQITEKNTVGGKRGNDGNAGIFEETLRSVLRGAAPEIGGERGNGDDQLVHTEKMPILRGGEAQTERVHENGDTAI